MDVFEQKLQKVKKASRILAQSSLFSRNRVLGAIARGLLRHKKDILAANARDLRALHGEPHWRDRLLLTDERLKSIIHDIRTVQRLPDPLCRILEKRRLPNGLLLTRTSVPLGVLGVIYEARPNVTVDVAILALKSGNAVVLKGGKESAHTNHILVVLMQQALAQSGLPKDALLSLDPKNRELVPALLKANRFVDVLIPRGGAGLIQFVREHATVPVIETGAGVCHTYVDRDADLSMAVSIVDNTKTQRPTVCNALDTLLVHRSIARIFLPILATRLAPKGVMLKADTDAFRILRKDTPTALLFPASSADFGKEFLSLTLAVKIVRNVNDACAHIAEYGSGHSEAIVTNNKKTAKLFLRTIDAACVYANASTRFTDGAQFGLGAEMGISTQKLHARGPFALEALTSYKWCIEGRGQIRK